MLQTTSGLILACCYIYRRAAASKKFSLGNIFCGNQPEINLKHELELLWHLSELTLFAFFSVQKGFPPNCIFSPFLRFNCAFDVSAVCLTKVNSLYIVVQFLKQLANKWPMPPREWIFLKPGVDYHPYPDTLHYSKFTCSSGKKL